MPEMDTAAVITAEALKRIAYRVRAAVVEKYRRDTCILTTAVLVDTLRALGTAAEPLTVGVVGMNLALASRIAQEGRMAQDNDELRRWGEEDGAWNVGIGYGFAPGREGEGWNNHLIATIPPFAGDRDPARWLIDASLDQIDRPDRGIEAGIVVARWHPDPMGRIPVEIRRGIAVYEPRPLDRSYETTENWRNMNRRMAIARRAEQLGDSAARILVQRRG